MTFEKINKDSEFLGYLDFDGVYYSVIKYQELYYSADVSNVGIIGLNSEGFDDLDDLYSHLLERQLKEERNNNNEKS